MASNTDITRATYIGISAENGAHLKAALAPDATWTEAAGFLMPAPVSATTRPSRTFAHLYRLEDGKIVTMEQYVDSAIVMAALDDNDT